MVLGIGLLVLAGTVSVLWNAGLSSSHDGVLPAESQGETDRLRGPVRALPSASRFGIQNQVAEGPATTQVRELSTGEAPASLVGVVRGSEGEPVSGARISLMQDLARSAGVSVEGPRAGETLTDSAGRFSFQGLASRFRLVLRVEHNAHASAIVPRIDLQPGRTTTRNIRLRTGRALAGTVVGVNGRGLAGIRIRLFDRSRRVENLMQGLEAEAVSAKDGTFLLPHIFPGVKRVVATGDGLATQTIGLVEVTREGALPPLMFRMPMGLSISGRVSDSTHAGLGGVVLTPVPKRRGTVEARPGYYPAAVSEDDGSFRIAGLAPGAYVITAVKPGFARDGVRVNARAGTENLTLEMVRNPLLQGRVVSALTGEPVPEYLLVINHTQTLVDDPSGRARFIRDEGGRFSIPAQDSSGVIHLVAKAVGHAWTSSGKLTLKPGIDQQDITIELTAGAEVGGRVVTMGGSPVAGAKVWLVSQPLGASGAAASFLSLVQRGAQRLGLQTKTDARGNYRFEHVHRGAFALRAEASDLATAHGKSPLVVSSVQAISCDPIVMSKGATIRGVVRDKDGKAVAGVRIEIRNRSHGSRDVRVIQSDRSGGFSAHHLAAGLHEVVAVPRSSGQGVLAILSGGIQPQEVLLSEGDDSRVDIVVEQHGGRRR